MILLSDSKQFVILVQGVIWGVRWKVKGELTTTPQQGYTKKRSSFNIERVMGGKLLFIQETIFATEQPIRSLPQVNSI